MNEQVTLISVGAIIITTMVGVVKYLHAEYQRINGEKIKLLQESNEKLLEVYQKETKEKFEIINHQMNLSDERCKDENRLLLELHKDVKAELKDYKDNDKEKVFSVVNNLAEKISHLSDIVEAQTKMIHKDFGA
jgi:predicted transcriptional regulator